jgi:methyl-accepting chemotaxis protein
MHWFNKLSIRKKISFTIMMGALLSSLITGALINVGARYLVADEALTQVKAVHEGKADAVQDYFNDIRDDLLLTASSEGTVRAIRDFMNGWYGLSLQHEDVTGRLRQLYIENNPHEAEVLHKLSDAGDGSLYSRMHGKHHPWFRNYLKRNGYYDIFLFDLKGNLLYTVYKEPDFATNMLNGEYQDSAIADAYRQAVSENAAPGDVFFYDFAPYAPSNGAPASFVATPVYNTSEEKIGVLAFQMPVDNINELMYMEHVLGESGKGFLIGQDYLLRTDVKDNGAKRDILATEVKTKPVKAALAGNNTVGEYVDHLGDEVIAAYAPIEVFDKRWVIVVEKELEQIIAPIARLQWMAILVTLVVIAFLGVAGQYIARSMSRPLKEITSSLQSLAHDKLDTDIRHTLRKDEIGDLANTAVIFREKLKEKHLLETKQAEEEKAHKQAQQELVKAFESKVQSIVTGVSSAVTQLNHMAESVAGSIRYASDANTDISAAVTQTASNVQSVASSAEELSASVQEISSQMQNTNAQVSESVERTEVVDKHASSLKDASGRVKEVIDLIADISSQINLLALNATIESARAGDAGKGFAVVASEVKNLASQTDKSIDEITRVIEDMNMASNDIVDSLASIKKSIGNISESSNNVASAVEEQSATTSEIAQNMTVAAESTSKVNRTMEKASGASQEASHAATEILQATHELAQQSEQLNIEVDAFLQRLQRDG